MLPKIPPARTMPPLGPNEAHVWRVGLNENAEGFARLANSLSPDEQARADRFRFACDRDRFAFCRGALREILGGYLACPASEIALVYGAYGKPALAAFHGSPVRFNVSHSNDVALIAVTHEREVGVDVEEIAAERPWETIAPSVFSPRERARIAVLPPAERLRAFFAFWTLKEAFLKANGAGFLGDDPRDFAVLPGADRRAVVLARDGSPVHGWLLQTLNAGDDHAAALAVAGDNAPTIGRFDFSQTERRAASHTA